MTGESVATEAADGLKSLFGRLGEFFHIFDLSFFVAGTLSFGAAAFVYVHLSFHTPFPFPAWVAGLGVILACYICGLLSFAVGRLINGQFRRRVVLERLLRPAVEMHALHGKATDGFLAHSTNQWQAWRYYIRLWQEMTWRHSRTVAFAHLSRYWAMAATFDGLGAAFILWAIAVVAVKVLGLSMMGSVAVISVGVLCVATAALCFYQGGKYYEAQVEDLIAVLAVNGQAI